MFLPMVHLIPRIAHPPSRRQDGGAWSHVTPGLTAMTDVFRGETLIRTSVFLTVTTFTLR